MPLPVLGAAVFFVTTGAYTLYKRMSRSNSGNKLSDADQLGSDGGLEEAGPQQEEQALVAQARGVLTDSNTRNSSIAVAEISSDGDLVSLSVITADAWRVRANYRIFLDGISLQRSSQSQRIFGVVSPAVAKNLQDSFARDPQGCLGQLIQLMRRNIVLDVNSSAVRQFLAAGQPPQRPTGLLRQQADHHPLSVLDAIRWVDNVVLPSPTSSMVNAPNPSENRRTPHIPRASMSRIPSSRSADLGSPIEGSLSIELGNVTHLTRDLNTDEKELIKKGTEVVKKIKVSLDKAKKILGNFPKEVKDSNGIIVTMERKVNNFKSALDSLNSSVDELKHLSRLMTWRIDKAHRRHDYLTDEAGRLFSSKLDAFKILIESTDGEIVTLNQQKESFSSSHSRVEDTPDREVSREFAAAIPASRTPNQQAQQAYERNRQEREQKQAARPAVTSSEDFVMPTSNSSASAKTNKLKKLEENLISKRANIDTLIGRLNRAQEQAFKILDDLESKGLRIPEVLDAQFYIFSELDERRTELTDAAKTLSLELSQPDSQDIDVSREMSVANRQINQAFQVLTKLSNFSKKALRQSIERAVEIAHELEPSTLLKGAVILTGSSMTRTAAREVENVVNEIPRLLSGGAFLSGMIAGESSAEAVVEHGVGQMMHSELIASELAAFRQQLINRGYDEAAVDRVLAVLSMLTRGQVLVVAHDNVLSMILSSEDIQENLYQILSGNPQQIRMAVLSSDQADALFVVAENAASQGLLLENAVLALEAFESLPVNPQAIQVRGAAETVYSSALVLPDNLQVAIERRRNLLGSVTQAQLDPLEMLRILTAFQMATNHQVMTEAERLLEAQQQQRAPHAFDAPRPSSRHADKILGLDSVRLSDTPLVLYGLDSSVSDSRGLDDRRDDIEQHDVNASQVSSKEKVSVVTQLLMQRKNRMEQVGRKDKSVKGRTNDDNFAEEMSRKNSRKVKASIALEDNKDTGLRVLDQMFSIVQQELATNVTGDLMTFKIEDLRSRLDRASYLTDEQRDLFGLKLAEFRRTLGNRVQSDTPLADITNLAAEVERLSSELRSLLRELNPDGAMQKNQDLKATASLKTEDLRAKYDSVSIRISEIRQQLSRLQEKRVSAIDKKRLEERVPNMMKMMVHIDNQLKHLEGIIRSRMDKIVKRSMDQVERMSDQEVAQAILFGAAAIAGSPSVVSTLRDGINQSGLLGDVATAGALVNSTEQQVVTIRRQFDALKAMPGLDIAEVNKIEQLVVSLVEAGKNPAGHRVVIIQNGRATYIRPDLLTPNAVSELLWNIQSGDIAFRLLPIGVAARFAATMAQADANSWRLTSDQAILLLDQMQNPENHSTELELLRDALSQTEQAVPSSLELSTQVDAGAQSILREWGAKDAAQPVTSSATDVHRSLLLLMGAVLDYMNQQAVLALMLAAVAQAGTANAEPLRQNLEGGSGGEVLIDGPHQPNGSRKRPLQNGERHPLDGGPVSDDSVKKQKVKKKVRFSDDLSLEFELERFKMVLGEIGKIYDSFKQDPTVSPKHLNAIVELHDKLISSMGTYLDCNNPKEGFPVFHKAVTNSLQHAENQFKDEGLVWNLIRPILNTVIQIVNAIRKHVMGAPEYGLFQSKATKAWKDSETIKQFKEQLNLEKKWNSEAGEPAARAAGSAGPSGTSGK